MTEAELNEVMRLVDLILDDALTEYTENVYRLLEVVPQLVEEIERLKGLLDMSKSTC